PRHRAHAVPLRARRRRAGRVVRRARGGPARGALRSARSRARELRPRRRGLGPGAPLEGPRERGSLRIRAAHAIADQVRRTQRPCRSTVLTITRTTNPNPERSAMSPLAKALMTAIYPVS